jgi:uncharacterized surface protein with fasciclin (FAS1) repeats
MKTMMLSLATLALVATPAFAGGCVNKHAAAAQETLKSTESETSMTKSDIVDTAAAAGSFNTLLAAATAAGLVDALKGAGPLTVFAPTDAAFAALPAGTVETLLKPENKDKLAGILKLHVIAGSKVTSDQLAGKKLSADTLNGKVAIDGTNGVTVNGANVVTADIEASNGVIHVIDKVLLPAS